MKIGLWVIIAAIVLPLRWAALARAQQQADDRIVKLAAGSDAANEIALSAVTRKQITGEISANATVEPDADAVAYITTRIPARVVKLVASLGQQVRAGQPLVILSSEELGRTKAEYLKTKSLESIAEQDLKREEDLYAKKIVPLKDVLDARAARDTALAQFKAARETLRLLLPPGDLEHLNWSESGRALSEFPLTSPIDGTLVKRQLTIGTMIDRSDDNPLIVINLDRVWVMAAVFEHDLAGLQTGEKASVTVEAYPGRSFIGKVTYVGSEIDRANRTVQARIEVPNPDHVLKPGMFAHAAIEVSEARRVLVAPESAIFDVGREKVAFVSIGNGEYAARRVELGVAAGGFVEVVSGLREGDRVVSRGGLVLKTLLTNRTAG